MKLVRSTWVIEYLDELEAFSLGPHDDQVDATSGAFCMISANAGGFVIKLHS